MIDIMRDATQKGCCHTLIDIYCHCRSHWDRYRQTQQGEEVFRQEEYEEGSLFAILSQPLDSIQLLILSSIRLVGYPTRRSTKHLRGLRPRVLTSRLGRHSLSMLSGYGMSLCSLAHNWFSYVRLCLVAFTVHYLDITFKVPSKSTVKKRERSTVQFSLVWLLSPRLPMASWSWSSRRSARDIQWPSRYISLYLIPRSKYIFFIFVQLHLSWSRPTPG
jgi:hypothetical protein